MGDMSSLDIPQIICYIIYSSVESIKTLSRVTEVPELFHPRGFEP